MNAQLCRLPRAGPASEFCGWKSFAASTVTIEGKPADGQILAGHSRTKRSRNALPMTDTELKLMAAAAMIGLSRTPKAG